MFTKRNLIFILGLFLIIISGLILIISNIVTDIQGISPFSNIAFIIMVGPGIVFCGLVISVIAGVKSSKKLFVTAIFFLLHFGFILLNNIIDDYKIYSFFEQNEDVLEQISTALFVSEISVEEAREIVLSEELPLESVSFDVQQQIVFFLIDDIFDNCKGIAFRFSGLKPLSTPCSGKIISWEKIQDGWYFWSTI